MIESYTATTRSLIAYDRSTVWRVVLLGVAAIAFTAMGIGLGWEMLGGPPSMDFIHGGVWWPLDSAELLVYLLLLWSFLLTTGVVLIPVLVRAELARVLMLPCLLMLIVTSLVAWTEPWPEQWWNVPYRVVLLAAGNGLLMAICCLQYRDWRKNSEGPARRRLPLAMQLWLQTLWLPWAIQD